MITKYSRTIGILTYEERTYEDHQKELGSLKGHGERFKGRLTRSQRP